jgi:DNA-binding MarR family transcriptional regulator
MAGVRAEGGDLAGQVTELLLDVGLTLRQRVDAEVGRLGLTPATARALYELDPERPSPARALATQLACDRSNVTGLVDKLEEAGLVERRVDEADRRVKTLVVTEAGRKVRAQMRQVVAECGTVLGEVSEADLRTLRDLLTRVAPPAP